MPTIAQIRPVFKLFKDVFLYCDGDRFENYTFLELERANMRFKMTLIPYDVDLSWIDSTLYDIKNCLSLDLPPSHSENCEYGNFISQIDLIQQK